MNKIESIQSLRGIAAMMVVFFHSIGLANYYLDSPTPILSYQLNSGVDIFFVISGIIMSSVLFRTVAFDAADFIIRRVIRIVPLYWLCTFLWLAIFPEKAMSDVPFLVRSLFFIPPLGIHGELEPFLAIGWSLTYEMFFYLALVLLYRGRPVPFLLSITFLFIFIFIVSLFYDANSSITHVILSPLKLEFLLGLWMGWFFLNISQISRVISLFSVVLGGIILVSFPLSPSSIEERYIYWGLPAALISFGFLNMQIKQPRIASWLGDISYSLYLTHAFSLRLFGRLLLALYPSITPCMLILISVICSLLVAALCFEYVEQPLLRAINISYRKFLEIHRPHRISYLSSESRSKMK